MSETFRSYNPATGKTVWEGKAFGASEIDHAIKSCQKAFHPWSNLPLDARIGYLKNFQFELKKNLELLSYTISEETGKPFWDSKSEVNAMINKIDISIRAYADRCKEMRIEIQPAISITRHKPHGVVAIFGPYNFPGHLPNGHIVPALLAGNTCIFKPSELTPKTALVTMEIWEQSGLPKGVLELVLGGRETGKLLAEHPCINGLFFTGSFNTGKSLLKQFANHPQKILALEMGGNNPLIFDDAADTKAASYIALQSAFLTSGQRCTCARRLIVVDGKCADAFIDELIQWTNKIKVGAFTDIPEPFMGPVISDISSDHLLQAQDDLKQRGGKTLVEMKRLNLGKKFLSPGIMDVTFVLDRKDEEIFGPFLQIIRVPDFKSALEEANRTNYGLSAGLISDSIEKYEEFYREIKAGVINWNMPLTGASSYAPFGGIGHSGNFRPSAYYATDYCAYPTASLECKNFKMPEVLHPGIKE